MTAAAIAPISTIFCKEGGGSHLATFSKTVNKLKLPLNQFLILKSERAILEGLAKSGLVLPVRVLDSQDSVVPDSDPRLSRFAGSELREEETVSVKDMDEWIVRIQETWVQRARNAFSLAKLMSAARRSLRYGCWSRLWASGRLEFSKRKGEKLVIVGQLLEGLDVNNCSHLPTAWNTLYYLAQLGRAGVERLIQQDRIHPRLSLQEAKELLAEHRPSTCRKTVPSKLRNRVAKLTAFVHEHIDELSLVEREFAHRQFLDLAKFIEMAAVGEFGAPSFPSRKLAKFAGQPRNIFQSP